MYKEYFAGMEWTALPLFALGLFLAMFVLMLLRTYAYKTRQDFEPLSQLPLDDGRPARELSINSSQDKVTP